VSLESEGKEKLRKVKKNSTDMKRERRRLARAVPHSHHSHTVQTLGPLLS